MSDSMQQATYQDAPDPQPCFELVQQGDSSGNTHLVALRQLAGNDEDDMRASMQAGQKLM